MTDPDDLDAADRSEVTVDDALELETDDRVRQTDNRPRPGDGPQTYPQDPGSAVEGLAVIDGTPEADA